jgi:hypothetical protein
MCDASDFAVGAILGQTKDKKHFAISYASKELLAMVFAIDKFISYLVGYIDHASLKYLLFKKDAKPWLI